MNPQFLELSRAQLSVSWKKSRFNRYSDKRKQGFHDNLRQLYDRIREVNFYDSDLNKDDYLFFKKVLEFFKDSLSLLDNNTISSVPHELIECLNTVARQWLNDYDEYIIVMQDGPYAISPQVEDIKMFYISIKAKLKVEFKNVLLKVCMPRQLSRDYLTNVCLFHELGHFIDEKLKISDFAYYNLLFSKWSGAKRNEINSWFCNGKSPYEVYPAPDGYQVGPDLQSYYYLKEYFADIFSSQYVDDNVFNYLEYSSDDPSKDLMRHPSCDKRKKMFLDFKRSANANPVLESLFESTLQQSSHGLVIKYVNLDKSDFNSFIPLEIKDESELLSVFKMGWEVFKGGSKPFEDVNHLPYCLQSDKIYECVNNLIEKTINNYLMIRDWVSAKRLIDSDVSN